MDVNKLLRARDIARMLDLSTPAVYALARRGVLPSVRIPHSPTSAREIVRFDPAAIAAYISAGGANAAGNVAEH